jgi:hypothetical protein
VNDKRAAERLDVLTMSGEVLVAQPIVVRQLSRSGMQIETACLLQLNTLHSFRLGIAGESMVVRGRVVHSRIIDVERDVVTYICGIEFVELSDRVAAAISEYLANLANYRDTLQQ